MSRPLRLGMMPLTDAVPLVVACEKGFFAAQGLEVELVREQAWATARDKVAFGVLDAAQMLAPMPIALAFGPGGVPGTVAATMTLDLNGNGITVSGTLADGMLAHDPAVFERRPIRALALARLIAERARGGRLIFGVVFPWSTHNYQLRWWLRDDGIDPDRDVEIVVIPPAKLAEQLADGRIDGYCVGEPWNQLAARNGTGRLLITSYEIWQNGAEKVLGVNARWAAERPAALEALMRALLGAAAWLERIDNRLEAARRLVETGTVEAPFEIVALSLAGWVLDPAGAPHALPEMHVFHRHAANFPWLSHAGLWAREMHLARHLAAVPDATELAAVWRADLFRKVAADIGLPCPKADLKAEGTHAAPWQPESVAGAPLLVGPDRCFDGSVLELPG